MHIVRWTGFAFVLLSLALLIAACAPAAAPATPTAPPVAEQPQATEQPAKIKIKVGMNAEYRPFEYVDESGNIVGFDVDLIKALAERAGFEVELINTKWDGIFTALAAGEFDVVCSAATITEERQQTVDFTDPYFNAGQSIAVLESNTEIKGLEDLKGKRIGVQLGTTGDIEASKIEGAEVKRYEEITLAFQALANGDVDAVINDAPTSAAIIKANPELKAKLVGEPFTNEFYGIAVNKNKPEIRDALNKALAEIKADGTYDRIYQKWFGTGGD
ncbi:MAG: basic amino acid ABC transporter substrate-binding protein [Anaerolineae bacterium]|nr:basic amino acid ABC transporter substrate-binding protein [Anaerolineae bacterium]MDW8099631.1 basic amino acid ABC transporter substrate-binding protein [Anaerolineae bacterium]